MEKINPFKELIENKNEMQRLENSIENGLVFLMISPFLVGIFSLINIIFDII